MAIELKVFPSCGFGEVTVPPSKSYTHRYLISLALSSYLNPGTYNFNNPLICNDTFFTLFGLEELGFRIRYHEKLNQIVCKGFTKNNKTPIISVGESASTLRFLIPLSMFLYDRVIFRGEESLFKRGIEVYYPFFEENHIKFELKDNYLDLSKETNTELIIPNHLDASVSSQYITGLLFIMPLLKQNTELILDNKIVSAGYLNITLDVLNQSGISFSKKDNIITIKGNQQYKLNPVFVPGDWTQGSFFVCLNQIEGNTIFLENLDEVSFQDDANIHLLIKKMFEENQTIDLDDNIDLAPILFSLAALECTTTFINIKRLEIKESNRIEEMIKIFDILGVRYAYIKDESLTVYKCENFNEDCVFETNDHRITQALLLLLLSSVGGTIKDVTNLNKSYPRLIPNLLELGFYLLLKYEEKEEVYPWNF